MRALSRTTLIALTCALAALLPGEAAAEPGSPSENERILGTGPVGGSSPWVNRVYTDVATTVPNTACKDWEDYIVTIANVSPPPPPPGWVPGHGLSALDIYTPELSRYLGAVQIAIANCNFDGVATARWCFQYQINTPGTLHANPDPGLVDFEAWFWLEGLLSGDQAPLPRSNVLTRHLDSSTQATGVWPSPPPTADGIWLIDTASVPHVSGTWQRCRLDNMGLLLDPSIIPTGGHSLNDAQQYFRAGHSRPQYQADLPTPLHRPNPIPGHPGSGYNDARIHTTYAIDTNHLEYIGDLTLGPYAWDFGDRSPVVTMRWGAVGAAAAGEAPPSGVNPVYSGYGGLIRHRYQYHGVFDVSVEVPRELNGLLRYVLTEVHTYDERWPPTPVTGNGPNGTWNARCPQGQPPSYRVAPSCQMNAWNSHTEWTSYGTPPTPPVTVPPTPPITCADSTEWFSESWSTGGGYTSSQGGPTAGTPGCSYGASYETYYDYNERYLWGDYLECRNHNNDPVAYIVRNSLGVWECFDAHVWAAPHRSKDVKLLEVPVEPSTMKLEHLPGYGLCSSKPSAVICIGYPVRRGSPTLIPNP